MAENGTDVILDEISGDEIQSVLDTLMGNSSISFMDYVASIIQGKVPFDPTDMGRQLIQAPVLIISLVVGLIISIFQTVTSIQEQTLTFVPKIVAVFIGLMVCGSWILNQLSEFVTTLWSNFSIYLG